MERVLTRETYFKDQEKIVMLESYYRPYLTVHAHEFIEILYFCSGKGAHTIAGRRTEIARGDIFLINYNTPHDFVRASDDLTWINCLFLPEVFDESLIESHNAMDLLQLMLFRPFAGEQTKFTYSINVLNQFDEFQTLFLDMLREYQRKETGYQLVLKSFLTVLLARLFRRMTWENHVTRPKSLVRSQEMMREVMTYLQENYSRPLTLVDVARQVFLSPAYFSGIFKKNTGFSLTDYIQALRIKEACRLLIDETKSISQVMEEVGYSSSRFFYDIFRKQTGMTPGKYRSRKP